MANGSYVAGMSIPGQGSQYYIFDSQGRVIGSAGGRLTFGGGGNRPQPSSGASEPTPVQQPDEVAKTTKTLVQVDRAGDPSTVIQQQIQANVSNATPYGLSGAYVPPPSLANQTSDRRLAIAAQRGLPLEAVYTKQELADMRGSGINQGTLQRAAQTPQEKAFVASSDIQSSTYLANALAGTKGFSGPMSKPGVEGGVITYTPPQPSSVLGPMSTPQPTPFQSASAGFASTFSPSSLLGGAAFVGASLIAPEITIPIAALGLGTLGYEAYTQRGTPQGYQATGQIAGFAIQGAILGTASSFALPKGEVIPFIPKASEMDIPFIGKTKATETGDFLFQGARLGKPGTITKDVQIFSEGKGFETPSGQFYFKGQQTIKTVALDLRSGNALDNPLLNVQLSGEPFSFKGKGESLGNAVAIPKSNQFATISNTQNIEFIREITTGFKSDVAFKGQKPTGYAGTSSRINDQLSIGTYGQRGKVIDVNYKYQGYETIPYPEFTNKIIYREPTKFIGFELQPNQNIGQIDNLGFKGFGKPKTNNLVGNDLFQVQDSIQQNILGGLTPSLKPVQLNPQYGLPKIVGGLGGVGGESAYAFGSLLKGFQPRFGGITGAAIYEPEAYYPKSSPGLKIPDASKILYGLNNDMFNQKATTNILSFNFQKPLPGLGQISQPRQFQIPGQSSIQTPGLFQGLGNLQTQTRTPVIPFDFGFNFNFPPYKPNLSFGIPGLGFFEGSSGRRQGKRKFKRSPSLAAIGLGIYGKPNKMLEQTGLFLRPLTKRQRGAR